MSFTDYTPQPTGAGGSSPSPNQQKTDYLDLGKLKKQYTEYLFTKRNEIDEQITARRYRHGAQLTDTQRKTLKRRKQPAVIFNRIGRKIDGVIGLVEKMRQDPKAYPRTPQHEEGAELATAAIRYVLDEQEWRAKSPICADDAATDGIGGLEVVIEQGDHGDPEIGLEVVSSEDFFYDPRSFRLDFSDARYMGVGKWMDTDAARDMFPDKAALIDGALQSGSELTSNSDRDLRWYQSDQQRIRIVDHWYRRKGEWFFCIYTGATKLAEGKSYLSDEKGKTICKYIMFSANVDHDGDRYGFVRQLKDAQDEINSRRSKGLHELNTRRIVGEVNAFSDIEKARREAARPDGIVLRNPGTQAQFDDTAKLNSMEGQIKFLQEAKDEIENFGPNPALIGQGIENKSGRAIALLQQAGIAELGPYILAHRGWKLRVYRAVWNAAQRNWMAERWIRITDDDGLAQFIQVNGLQTDPRTGLPQMFNKLGALDVDIILDEGADSITTAQEANEVIGQVLQSVGPMLTPPEARAAVQILIDTSPLPFNAKKMFREAAQQAAKPDPAQMQAKQIAMAGEQAKVEETQSKTTLNYAKAQQAGFPGPQDVPDFKMPPEMQMAQVEADIRETNATADHKMASARKLNQDVALAPLETIAGLRQPEPMGFE